MFKYNFLPLLNSYKMKAIIQIIGGLTVIVFVLLLLTYTSWFWATIKLIQGGFIVFLAVIGIVMLLLGISEVREATE